MTATERLRTLLDERGVEYEAECIDFSNYLTWGENDCYSYTEYPDGTVLRIWDCTPEQATAATMKSDREAELEALAKDLYENAVDFNFKGWIPYYRDRFSALGIEVKQ